LSAPSPAKAALETKTVPAKATVAMQRIKTPKKAWRLKYAATAKNVNFVMASQNVLSR
jgi:hypothetical protein